MADDANDELSRAPGSFVVRAVVTVVLLITAAVLGWGYGYWPVGLGVFIAAVIVAPSDWFKGYAGSWGGAGPTG